MPTATQPLTWPELIARLTPDRGDRGKLARALEVNRRTVYDWAAGVTRPRGRAGAGGCAGVLRS